MLAPGTAFTRIVALEGKDEFENNTLHAAAVMACGVRIKTFKTLRERTGETMWSFDYDKDQIVFGSMRAAQLVNWYRGGQLAQTDPDHPVFWAETALRNRQRLLEWILKGRTMSLQKHPVLDRWQYEPSLRCELPAVMRDNTERTEEFKLPCVLGCFGIPLMRTHGDCRAPEYEIGRIGFAGAATPPATLDIVREFQDGTLDLRAPDHPFFIAWSAVECIQRLKRHMKSEIPVAWIEKPRSTRGVSAFIRTDANATARDDMHRHFKRAE